MLRLDRVMADRKISLNELSEKVGVANVNLSKELLEKSVQSLKDSINAELTVEKMVEKCIFCIY